MSTKTMKQRIALVAVTALTAGLFSVIAAPAARAAEAAAGTEGVILVSGSTCRATNAAGGAPLSAAGSEADASPFESGSTAGRILTVAVGGSLKVAYDAADIITMSGPLSVTNLTGQGLAVTTNATVSATNGKTIITGNAADSDVTLSALAVGTGVLTISATAADPTVTDANTIYINIVAACTNTTYSAATSTVYVKGTDGTTVDGATNVDTTLSATSGSSLFINITGKNAYSVAMTTGVYSVSATNGALVALTNAQTAAPVKGTTSTITGTPDGTDMVRIDPSQTATTSTTVVTITHSGTAVATKTLTFHGEQASIVLAATYSGRTSTADSGVVVFQYKDSAGNVVPGGAAAIVPASAGTRITTATSILAPNPGTKTTLVANASLADNMEYKLGGSSDNGVMAYTCGSSAGTADFTIATTSTVNANTVTATVTGKCYGGLSTYTVATDKAKYNIGDIATLTISAKDSSGNPVSDNTQLQASSVSVGGGTVTYTVLGTAAAGALETFTNGTVVIRAQMTTEGTFNTVVALTGAKDASATATYTVVNPATVGAVSNADVLKSIVALIASINKQIAALQKLILARR